MHIWILRYHFPSFGFILYSFEVLVVESIQVKATSVGPMPTLIWLGVGEWTLHINVIPDIDVLISFYLFLSEVKMYFPLIEQAWCTIINNFFLVYLHIQL